MELRRLTKKPQVVTTVRLLARDRDLMYLAASREGVSQSEFLRVAVRERAERVLQGASR
jgi:uncharacterized protein (DUF1778 family)